MFNPRYEITSAIATALMDIEASRQAIVELPIDVEVLAGLRHSARLAATHYSTQIEGNRLTEAQVEEVLEGAHFPGRERDESEVRNYHTALDYVESLTREDHIDEKEIQRIHGVVLSGSSNILPYRDGQNVIRAARSGGIVYLPPEALDVPTLMADLVAWINREHARREVPAPVIAAIAHYQYATIHPYYDGNGRTARLLTTLLLHMAGYGLKGIYSLEQHYARNLPAYYEALNVGPSHNYYLGRAEADISGFIEFFCQNMAWSFADVRAHAGAALERGARDETATLRSLDPRQRRILELFRTDFAISTSQIASHLHISSRAAAGLVRRWMEAGFLVVHNPSRKARSYRLADVYEKLFALSRKNRDN